MTKKRTIAARLCDGTHVHGPRGIAVYITDWTAAVQDEGVGQVAIRVGAEFNQNGLMRDDCRENSVVGRKHDGGPFVARGRLVRGANHPKSKRRVEKDRRIQLCRD